MNNSFHCNLFLSLEIYITKNNVLITEGVEKLNDRTDLRKNKCTFNEKFEKKIAPFYCAEAPLLVLYSVNNEFYMDNINAINYYFSMQFNYILNFEKKAEMEMNFSVTMVTMIGIIHLREDWMDVPFHWGKNHKLRPNSRGNGWVKLTRIGTALRFPVLFWRAPEVFLVCLDRDE